VSKKHVRNASHDFASVELVHQPHPPNFKHPQGASVGRNYDRIREKIRSFTGECAPRAVAEVVGGRLECLGLL
jgi:hypothetical protein